MAAESRTPSIPAEAPLPEGEEHAPPGTRAMALVRWSLVGLMAVAAAGAWLHHASSGGLLSAAEERFHCPMHPSIVTTHRGECPICGMDLVPVGGAAARTAAPAPAATPDAGHPAAAGPLYTCPMHPAFVTADAKARCPDCGMKLVPKEPATAAGEGVPGLAEVELTVDRIQLIGMKTAAARREPLASSLRTVGFVTPTENGLVSVNTRFSGWVESLGVSETGVLVQKGTVLATVYSPEMLNAQQVFLNAIKWSERRAPPPPPGGAAAPAQSATSQPVTDLERDARQRLELLGVSAEDIELIAQSGQVLRAINVRAPVRGHVARRSVLRGVYVQPGTELFQITDLSTVWVLADVYESELGRVKVGQRATLALAAWPGERFEGRVTFIYPAVSTGSRTLQARVEIRNPQLKLRPGMYGDVVLETGGGEAVVVPRDAVVDTGDVQYVFVDRGQGRFAPRKVRPGAAAEGKVAILEGLAEGERVVTTANFLLDSESRLRAALEGGGESAAPAATGPRN
ncbi:efflux RND transporter periplasmic adaptor subunit [Anaeromyxobacter oryzae]|uniref:RND transporter n=1 Tax=Anaeromyxobacter oryzae TaxID=2918170 RepID=A0ABM7X2H0_9BACT|nr:efflux RND transporter periplasmic adaptor subunit [Anaeromyxobacter oryzae]BDG05977.1 RND transporter [Anaeromyxobacter oryzae]